MASATPAPIDTDSELAPPSPTVLAVDSPALALAPPPTDPKQVDVATQARLEALLEAAGVVSSTEEARRALADPEILRRLTNSVSSALDEAAAALSRIRTENEQAEPRHAAEEGSGPPVVVPADDSTAPRRNSLADLYASGDVGALSRLLTDGKGLHDLSIEESDSLLSLACSAGYFELAQVLLAMRSGGSDEGVKCDSTALMEAASAGHVDIVKLLKEHGADVNAQSEAGNTALTYAACGGFEDVVEVLLDAGAKIEEQNESGHTPLMEAASAGHVGVAKLLIEHGAKVNTPSNEFKETALTLAAYKGHADMVKFLLENGADKEHKTDEMHNALMEACMDGHVEVATILLNHGAQINMPVDGFEAPLTLAACGGHTDLARLLIDCGANLEELNDEGYTPLMEAAREGNDVMCLLVESGANVNAITEETQETPLSLACCGGVVEVATYLLDHGADIELGASTPIMEAAQEGHYDLVKVLLEREAKANAVSSNGDSALVLCSSNGHTDVAELLLNAGADLEHKAEGGRTPLMKSARAGHLSTTQFLISRGANVNRKTANNDHTVLSLACAGGHLPIVELLLARGADPTHILKDSSTMLIEASKGGHVDVASLLLNHGSGHAAPPTPAAAATTSTPSVKSKMQTAKSAQLTAKIKKSQQKAPVIVVDDHPGPPPKPSPVAPPPSATSSIDAATFPSFTSIPPTALYAGMGLTETDAIAMATELNRRFIPPPPSRSPPRLSVDEIIEERISPEGQEKPRTTSAVTSSSTTTTTSSSSIINSLALESGAETLQQFALMAKKFAAAETATTTTSGDDAPPGGHGFNFTFNGAEGAGAGQVDSLEFATPDLPSEATAAALGLSGGGTGAAGFQPAGVLAGAAEEAPYDLGTFKPSFCTHDHHHHHHHHHHDSPQPQSQPQSQVEQQPPSSYERYMDTVDYPGLRRQPALPAGPPIDIDMQTESNHDTALTLACAGGHDDLVELLLRKGADLEHRDKKGYTPLILAATAGHSTTVDILLQHGAVIEAQSDRTKDTALSLACSGGRLEVVDILLAHNADYEHRNVSDYTPLSLAASGGFVNTIKTLLAHGAEINSRTGSKLGISPLMLAAMNGHTAAVKLLLDRGSDINAQIETNRNTALTLACFQGRHEVVQLLIDRRANIEHRAKTGLTPLMEAASGGYVEVGQILIHSGADANASPVPSSKDTALTIAADKGHGKFVELLLKRKAHFDVRNKKGASPLWLACNGGHYDVVQALVKAGADVDVEDNRKVSCLMAAFRKAHVKVVKYMVKVVNQFPNDSDLLRVISAMPDMELAKKSNLCRDIIVTARDRQAAEANRHANSLLRELAMERMKEENRKEAAARRRDKRKRQKQRRNQEKEERERAKMTQRTEPDGSETATTTATAATTPFAGKVEVTTITAENEEEAVTAPTAATTAPTKAVSRVSKRQQSKESKGSRRNRRLSSGANSVQPSKPAASAGSTATPSSPPQSHESSATASPRGKGVRRPEDGWKEVVRKSKRMVIPASVVNRIIGRGGVTLTAVREATGAHIDLDKARSAQERIVTIKGSTDAVRVASNTLTSLIREPDREVYDILPRQPAPPPPTPSSAATRRTRDPVPPSSSSSSTTTTTTTSLPSSAVASAPMPPPVTPLHFPNVSSRQQQQTKSQNVAVKFPAKTVSTTTTTSKPAPAPVTVTVAAPMKPKFQPPVKTSRNSTAPSPVTTTTTTTTAVAATTQKPPIKRQLFSDAAAAAPQTRQQRAAAVAAAASAPPNRAQPTQNRSNVSAATQAVPSPVATPAWTPNRNVWNTGGSQKTVTITEAKPSAVSVATTMTSFTPLSHFEPLIPAASTSGSSSKAPSPLQSPSAVATTTTTTAASPVGASPSSNQSKSPVPIPGPKTSSQKPIGGERARESPSPSSGATEEKAVLPIGTERQQQQQIMEPVAMPNVSGSAVMSRGGVTMAAPTTTTAIKAPKPIGTERRTARRSERAEPVPTAIVTPDSGRPSHTFNPPPWGIPTFRPGQHSTESEYHDAPVSWSLSGVPVPSQMAAAAAAAASLPAPPPPPPPVSHPHHGRMPHYGGLNSLATLLDKLSLTKHLDLFQQNEIDLDALMLMSEKDYAEIGLPKGPRIKLLNATRRRVDDTGSGSGEPFTSPLTSPSPVTSTPVAFAPYASSASGELGGGVTTTQSSATATQATGQRWDSGSSSSGSGGGGMRSNAAAQTSTSSSQRQQGSASTRNTSKGEWKGWNQAV